MDWFVKHWDELTRDELYDLLAVRTAVFVVEQRCPYQEADGLDRRAWHVFARDGGGAIQACLRILEPENGTAQIGRVLTVDRGAGLGRALMENFHFERSGVALAAAFDVAPEIVGQVRSGVPVYHVDKLEDYLAQNPASIGVLTVPRSVANATASRLVRAGVRGIWNFTNSELTVDAPGEVIEDVHFADSLLALSYMISQREDQQETGGDTL